MADLATLRIDVDATGAVQVLDQYGAAVERAGARTGQSTTKVAAHDAVLRQLAQTNRAIVRETGTQNAALAGLNKEQRENSLAVIESMGGLERYAAIMRELEQAEIAASTSKNQVTDSTRRMTLMHMEAIRMNEALAVSNVTTASGFATIDLSANRGRLAVGRLSNSFASLLSQAAGVHPVLGNVVSVLGSFAIGSILLAGVLAGLAAVSFWYRKLTEDARQTKKEIDELNKSFDEQAKAARLATVEGAMAMKTFREWQVDAAELAVRTAKAGQMVYDPATQAMTKRIVDLKAVLAAERELTKARERLADATERVTEMQMTASEEGEFGITLNSIVATSDRAQQEMAQNAKSARELALRSAIDAASEAGKAALGIVQDQLDAERAAAEVRKDLAAEVAAARAAANRRAGDIWEAEQLRRDKEAQDAQIAAQERAAREIENRNKEMLDRMQGHWSDFFYNILTGGVSAFRDLFAGVKAMFLRLISEMLAQRFVQKMAGVMAGVLGTASAARAQGAGATAGAGFLGSNAWGAGGKMLGAAGLGLGVGYGVGSMTTNRALGGLGGAAGGALAGFAVGGPVGAAIGGLAGFVSGIFGAGSAAKRAAKELAELQKSLKLTLDTLRARATGDELAEALIRNRQELQALLLEIDKAFPGKKYEAERNRQRQEAIRLEDQLAQKLKDEFALKQRQLTEDLMVRALESQGRSAAAQEMAFALQQEREMAEAIRNRWTAEQIATLATVQAAEALQRTADIERERRRALEDLNLRLAIANGLSDEMADDMRFMITQQREYEDAVRAGRDELFLATLQEVHRAEAIKRSIDKVRATILELERTIEGLVSFRNALLLSGVSALGPEAQLSEARRQYEEVLGQARTGDQAAAGRLPAAAQAFLDFSRQVNATGPAFAADFQRVLAETNELIRLFETQKSVQEQQLAELMRIRAASETTATTLVSRLQPADTTPSVPWPTEFMPTLREQLEEERNSNRELRAIVAVLQDGIGKIIFGQDRIVEGVDTTNRLVREQQALQ